MTKEELLAIPHTWHEEGKFIHLHTDEGYLLTDYFDDGVLPITQYRSTNCAHINYGAFYADLRAITLEEDAMYQKQAAEALEAEFEALKDKEIL